MSNNTENSKIIVEALQDVLQWHDGLKGIKDDLAKMYMDFNDMASNEDSGNRFAEHFFLLHNMYLMFEHLEKHMRIK